MGKFPVFKNAKRSDSTDHSETNKIVTDYGEYTNRDHFYKMTDELKKQSEIAEAAENICDDLAKIDQFIKKHSYKGIRDEDMLNIKDHMNAVRKILDSYEQE